MADGISGRTLRAGLSITSSRNTRVASVRGSHEKPADRRNRHDKEPALHARRGGAESQQQVTRDGCIKEAWQDRC